MGDEVCIQTTLALHGEQHLEVLRGGGLVFAIDGRAGERWRERDGITRFEGLENLKELWMLARTGGTRGEEVSGLAYPGKCSSSVRVEGTIH